jgi:hypothetical protein
MSRPTTTHDLSPSEQRFVEAMTELGYGRFESLRIERGELILDPWPSTVRHVKFSVANLVRPSERSAEFDLKRQVAEFYEYVRSVETGEIRTLEIQHGLPFSMEIGHQSWPFGARRHA